MKEDALYLFQAGLRDYLGSCRIKIHGGQHSGWRITSLSVSASKIVPIPSGTCSIMKYFRGQDHSCSYKQINEFVSEAAPISPSDILSGNKSCSGLYTTKTSIEFNKDENSGLAATSLDQLDGNREEFIEESKCESTQSAGHQDSSSMLSKQGKVDFAPETSEVSSKDSHGEKLGIKRLAHGTRSHELKRKKEKDKGTSTILRFFQNCSKYSSSPEEKQGRAVDETKASSSSGFQSMNSCSELNEAKVSEDNIISETGIHSGKLTLGEDEMQNDGWSYKIDEIDHSVIYELPPEIQQEVLAWLQPQKRANIAKRGSTIAQYFFPTKST
ncbi:DNA-directed DNA polymerase [Bertholletia excelsa]